MYLLIAFLAARIGLAVRNCFGVGGRAPRGAWGGQEEGECGRAVRGPEVRERGGAPRGSERGVKE